ncbi:ParA family protein [Belnapia sp. F-4-1]|uniref:ParA family protein n=1 Tax=Belnapia sp. F-4-1 TaxID=1545443 RepID=UPI0009E01842|nr:ParA family protein [Belnapia sp. F-4-1]
MRTKATAGGRVLLIASPKGGVGKSSMCRNILVAAAIAGARVQGVDLDAQQTLVKWHQRRELVRKTYPETPEVPVVGLALSDWRAALREAPRFDLTVIDTPPSIEVQYGAAVALCQAAHHVLVPTGATQDDVDSVTPWMRTLTEAGVPASFVLNKANRRVKSYEAVRTKLLKAGALCPVEIPMLEDIHVSAGKGLAVLDLSNKKTNETFEALWAYVSRAAGMKVSVEAPAA